MSIRPLSQGVVVVFAVAAAITCIVLVSKARYNADLAAEQCVYYNGTCVPISAIRMNARINIFP